MTFSLHAALRGFRHNGARLWLGALAITLSVAFVVAGTMVAQSVRLTLVQGQVELPLATTSVLTPEDGRLPESAADLGVPWTDRQVVVLGADGQTPLAEPRRVFSADDRVVRLLAGAAPAGPRELALDPETALIVDAGIGDTVAVRTTGGTTEEWRLVGLADPRMAQTGVTVSAAGMQALLGPGFDEVLLTGGPQPDAAAVAAAGLAAGTVLTDVTGLVAQQRDAVAASIGVLGALLSSLTLVTAVAGTFVISNTFQVSASARRREAALLRAIGATRRQVGGLFLIEALLLGVVAAGIGLLVGAVGGAAASSFIGFAVTPSGSTLALGLIMGLVLTAVGIVRPARTVADAPPVAALGTAELTEVEPPSRVRWLLAAPLLAATAMVLQVPLVGAVIGGLLTFIVLVVLGPIVVPRIGALVMAGPFRRGPVARIARSNVVRYPRRSARTTSAVLMGVALVASTTALVSATGNVDRLHNDRQILVLAPSVSGEMVEQLEALDGVGEAWSVGRSQLILVPASGGGAPIGLADLVASWPGAHIATSEDRAGETDQAYGWIEASLGMVAAMSLLVGLIGVLNTVRLTALERRREFAVLRAVGMTRRQLVRLVVAEATGLTGIGVVLGLLLGAATIYGMLGIASVILLPLVSWWLIALVCAVVIVAVGIGAILPARSASRVQPAAALARAAG